MPRALRTRVRALIYAFALSTVFACNAGEHEGPDAPRGPATEEPREMPLEADAEPAPAQHARDASPPAMPSPTVVPAVVPNRSDAGAGNSGDVTTSAPDGGAEQIDNDLTFACWTDSDCNFGACYVPGGQSNPICSKRCSIDADCPEGALCAAPLECTDGVGCEGRGYCFRACQTHDECLALNPRGTLPSDDPDEANPVNCIGWTDIVSDGEPAPPIDICIQHSEP